MSNENGVTLISLIAYIVLITLVVAGVSAVTSSLYSNVNLYKTNTKSEVSLAKFDMYLLKDIKKEGVRVTDHTDTSVSIFYQDGSKNTTTTYSFKNDSLYKDDIRICDGVDSATFTVTDKSGSNPATIKLNVKIEGNTKEMTYTLEPKIVDD